MWLSFSLQFYFYLLFPILNFFLFLNLYYMPTWCKVVNLLFFFLNTNFFTFYYTFPAEAIYFVFLKAQLIFIKRVNNLVLLNSISNISLRFSSKSEILFFSYSVSKYYVCALFVFTKKNINYVPKFKLVGIIYIDYSMTKMFPICVMVYDIRKLNPTLRVHGCGNWAFPLISCLFRSLHLFLILLPKFIHIILQKILFGFMPI